MSNLSDIIIGIDLGTSNSVVAVLQEDGPQVITNSEGQSKTPSIVCLQSNGEVLVGEVARRQASIAPERTITSVKRLIGRTLEDIHALDLKIPYELTMMNGELLVCVDGRGYRPSQVSAYILMKLKQAAEDYLGKTVSQAVITVPAYFDDLQRQATREAAQLAGLEVVRMINEPTAAAMAYGLGRSGSERIAVFDLGGGTFDLTVLEISENAFEVITTAGDTHLGGDDIDEALIGLLLSDFRSNTGYANYRPDSMGMRRLKEAAEKAKCDLSMARQTAVSLPFLTQATGQPLHLETSVTRGQLEDVAQSLIERCIDICEEALDDVGLDVEDIDRVLLVGGATRMPLVQEMVENFFGKPPFKGLNPDEVVAVGAATQAGVLAGKLKEVILLDVTPHSLGVEVEGGRFVRLIEKNSTIPVKQSRMFTTIEDNQDLVMVHVLQGESDRVAENRSLGRFSLSGIAGGRAGAARVQISFSINADGMVEVLAEDVSTGVSRTIKLLMSGDEPSPLARKAGRETGSRRRRSRRSGRDSDSPGRRQEGRRPGDGSSAIQPVFTPTGGADQKLEAHQIPSDASAAVILPPQTATELAGVVLPLQPHPAVVSASAEIREVSQKDLEKNQIEQSPAHPMDSRGPGPVSLSSLVIPPPPPASADASSTDGRGTRAQASPDPPTSVPYGTEYRNYMGETALPMPVSSGSANPSAAGASGTGSRARQSGMPDVVRKALNYMDAGDRGPIARAHYLEATEPLQVYILQNLHLFQEASKAVSILIEIEEKAGARRILQALGNQPDTDPSAVAGLYEQFLQKFPQDNEATNGLAKSLSMAGREDEAIVRLESITNKDDSSAIQVETLIQLYRNRLSTVPDDHAVQFKLIKLLIRTGKIDEAVNLLQRLVTVESYKVRALKILGLCFWQKGLHYLAWQKLQQLPLNDEIRDILYRLSQDMEDTDQILNAKVVLQHLVQDNPNYRDASERLKKVEQLIRMEAGKPEANLTPSIFLTMKDSRFVILEEINRGSMGIVYRAKDKVLDEIIALKILNDYMTADQNAVERFKREARAAKRLAHPNIVRIHDMFEYGDKKILSMEHIEGRDLKKVLIEKKTLGTQEIVKIGKAVADALGYAHGLSVVHRDIKPANIMITSDDRVKVTDFGIAKLLAGNDTTRSGSQIIGTPLYMSPEQIRGLAVDARTDIYSLGATLYEAACGRPPFMEGNIEYHHLHTPPPALPDSVDPKLASIIMKCLEKDPENRWEDTQVLVKALSEVEAQ